VGTVIARSENTSKQVGNRPRRLPICEFGVARGLRIGWGTSGEDFDVGPSARHRTKLESLVRRDDQAIVRPKRRFASRGFEYDVFDKPCGRSIGEDGGARSGCSHTER
jgi:hypothetical protein